MKTAIPNSLPDFRNLGVILRMLLLALTLRLIFAFILTTDLTGASNHYLAQGLLFEPVLLLTTAVLYVVSPGLLRLPYRWGVLVVLLLVALLTLGVDWSLRQLYAEEMQQSLLRSALLAAGLAATLLFYFNWRQLRLSPVAGQARLMALQARIQPHFLFNSLNSVLGLIRDEPHKAEAMLENLADLFRALLAEPRVLVPWSRELELARAYAEIESIRFGSRLRINWQCDHAPAAALVPPLLLQPLVENAVMYGVAGHQDGANISVEAYQDDGHLVIFVRNPCAEDGVPTQGNHLALANLRERLELHFDVQASLRTTKAKGEFVVCVRLPIHYA
ncbi:MAG: histidine kinase [Burkholderiaceae bacterium]